MDDSADIVWRALADPTRRGLLDELRDGPRTTGELVDRVSGMTRFGVMKHLKVLEDAGLVISRKEGRQRWNHLNAVPLRMIYERWVSRYEDRWAGSLMNLKRRAEAPGESESDMGTKLLDQPARIAVVETAIDINAPRERVFDAFFEDTASWFYESEDTRETQPSRIERRVGGIFSMTYANGDENMLGWVTMIKEGRKVRLRGDCTMPGAVIMNMTVAFEDAADGCRVSISHRMAGEFADADPADFEAGWADGLAKLKTLCEG
ncbi:MAG: metalloregulator ArsR/SmtB family transcription factor [Phycisphaerales bacterium]